MFTALFTVKPIFQPQSIICFLERLFEAIRLEMLRANDTNKEMTLYPSEHNCVFQTDNRLSKKYTALLRLIFIAFLYTVESCINKLQFSFLLHRAFRRITLIINQQMHLHKISH